MIILEDFQDFLFCFTLKWEEEEEEEDCLKTVIGFLRDSSSRSSVGFSGGFSGFPCAEGSLFAGEGGEDGEDGGFLDAQHPWAFVKGLAKNQDRQDRQDWMRIVLLSVNCFR